MINFNEPLRVKNQEKYISDVFNNGKYSGDGVFTKKCHEWLENYIQNSKALLTTSCSHALDMSAILAGIKDGDEVIMPSFTFVSTANAFVLRGAKIVFVDIRPDTMNIDEKKIEQAITGRTKVIVPVHYAGVSCQMEDISKIAQAYNLLVIEDAAQCIGAYYNDKPLGIYGDLSCFSFHETKNIQCGEGGALLINNRKFVERAEIIREKGTNRARFFRGQVDKYSWIDMGSSYLPSELNAAILYAQLEQEQMVTAKRICIWNNYYNGLKDLEQEGLLELPNIPQSCKHNAHIFYIKLKDIDQRQKLIEYLKQKGISTSFHYIPLHSAEAGLKFGRFDGIDEYTTRESERLLRLPLHCSLTDEEVSYVVKSVTDFLFD